MIAALLMVLAPAGQASPLAEDEIVVTGQRLKNLRVVLKRDRRTGGRRCFVKPSSGDATFDAGICAANMACYPTARTAAAMEACMRPPLTALVAEWLARRKAASATPR